MAAAGILPSRVELAERRFALEELHRLVRIADSGRPDTFQSTQIRARST